MLTLHLDMAFQDILSWPDMVGCIPGGVILKGTRQKGVSPSLKPRPPGWWTFQDAWSMHVLSPVRNGDRLALPTQTGHFFAHLGKTSHPHCWSHYLCYISHGKSGHLFWSRRDKCDYRDGGVTFWQTTCFSAFFCIPLNAVHDDGMSYPSKSAVGYPPKRGDPHRFCI